MSFYRSIEKLQKKPDHEKRRILVALSVLSGAVLLVGWFWTVRATLRQAETPAVKTAGTETSAAGSEPIESMRGPFASLKDGATLFAGDLKRKVGEWTSETPGTESYTARPYVALPIE